MNALLDIQIRVQAQAALAQLRALQGQINQLNSQTAASSAGAASGMNGLGRQIDMVSGKMVSWGKNMQWTGQQLTMSFTLPLLLMGGLATKWALENEAAFTRVRKVYSGAEGDLDKLRVSFELLSSRFGVNQAEVIGIGEAWAAVGAEGTQLAKSVENTMKFMILSGLDAQAATEGLIVTQSAYQLSTEQLTQAIADMNAIENATAADMGDLLEGLQKAGGAANLLGIDIRHLGAYMAALVPVTGGAAQAGTALKTIFSRIFVPTPEAEEMLRIIGVTSTEMGKLNWHMANGEERVNILAGATRNLTDEQVAVMSSVLGSRRQFNQLITLLDQVADSNGAYAEALRVTADSEDSAAKAAKELSIFLGSSPQGFKIMMTTLQNMMAKAIMPLLPALSALMMKIVNLVKWFTDLDPQTQQLIMSLLAMLAVLGPIIRYLGSFAQLFGVVGKFLAHATHLIFWFIRVALWGFIKMTAAGAAWAAQAVAHSAMFVAAQVRAFGAVALASAKSTAIQMANAVKLWAAYAIGTARALAWVAAQWIANAARVIAVTVAMYARLAVVWAAGVARQAIALAAQAAMWIATQAAMAASSVAAAAASAAAWLAANPYVLLFIVAMAAVVAAIAALIIFWDSEFVQGIRDGVVAALEWIGRIPEFLGGLVDSVENAISAIVEGIYGLPEAFQKALLSILYTVRAMIKQIVDWLSYLNPFQRHSPSLVDNVTAGVSEILRQYSRLSRVGSLLDGVRSAHESFTAVADPTVGNATQRKFATQRDAVAKGAPSVLPAFDRHVALITQLQSMLAPLESAIARQEQVVGAWADALRDANAALDDAEKVLKTYKDELQGIEDQISKAEAAISDLASTSITGMRKMEDAIFANEIAQKKLRLEILRIGKAFGGIDKLRDKFAELQGMIEKVRSEREDLRQAGAGSEILAEYDAQLEALEKQQETIAKTGDQISDLELQLEKLQLAAEEMELEKAITFDPQLRQIEQLASGLNELPFDEIVRRIREQQDEVARLQIAQELANQKVAEQTAEVERLTQARDAIQVQYDREKETLDEIKSIYDAVRDAISLLEGDLQGFSSALDEVNDKASELQRLMDEAVGDFESIADIAPEDLGSLDEFNAELQRQLDEALANLENFDLWQPLRDQWERFKAWWEPRWKVFTNLMSTLWATVVGWMGAVWNLFGAAIAWVFQGAMLAVQNEGGKIGFWWNGLVSAMQWVWSTLGAALKIIWEGSIFPIRVGIMGIQSLWSIMTGTMGADWSQVLGTAKARFEDFKRGLQMIWDSISGIFKGGANAAIGAIEGLLNAGIRMVNTMSQPLNSLAKILNPTGGGGPNLINFPDVRLDRLASGGITTGPALIGEGRKMYPEYVIPTDPMFFNQARSLYDMLGRELGISPEMASVGGGGRGYAGSIPSSAVATGGGETTNNFYGDLEFPNVKNGSDAKEFLDNLKSLGND